MTDQITKLFELLKEPMQNHITVEISIKKETIWANLKTRGKSDCHLECTADGIIAHRRYGRTDKVEDLDHLCELVAGCWHGRDYFDSDWITYLHSKGIPMS